MFSNVFQMFSKGCSKTFSKQMQRNVQRHFQKTIQLNVQKVQNALKCFQATSKLAGKFAKLQTC